jgi:hypothetical protein
MHPILLLQYDLGGLENRTPSYPSPDNQRYALFMETNHDHKEGTLFHTTRDISAPGGLQFETRKFSLTRISPTQTTILYLGHVKSIEVIEKELRKVPAPGRQQNYNPKTGGYERCAPNGRFCLTTNQSLPCGGINTGLKRQ